ncbi:MAG TPA: hypothetical protein VLH08_05220, partial [Acidobacteriota bacterium]|nr:hypothetical protein [Acidobacteriota bacterium]
MQTNQTEDHDKKGSSAKFRLNQSLQELLLKPALNPMAGEGAEVLTLPEPEFPQHKSTRNYTKREFDRLNL